MVVVDMRHRMPSEDQRSSLNIGAATLFANARRSVRHFKAGFLQRANEEFDILRTG